MAHSEQAMFVEIVRDSIVKSMDLESLTVLEIGSYDVNGTIRTLFSGASFTGVDIASGPGVDVVAFGHEFKAPDESYDLVLSCECFEHDPYWVETFRNMLRLAKAGGLVVFTCASTGRIEHGTRRTNPADSPGTQSKGIDYYRNLTELAFRKEIAMETCFSKYGFYYLPGPSDLYFVGKKHGSNCCADFELPLIDLDVANLSQKSKDLRRRQHGLLFRCAFSIYQFPIKLLAMLCPDAVFQNVVYWYRKALQLGR